MTDGAQVIDCDQHLYEPRRLWREHIDPEHRDDALAIVDDELGYPWLTWRDRRIELCDVQHPRDTSALDRHRTRARDGQPPEYSYDEALPADYWEPSVRVAKLDEMRLDEAVHSEGTDTPRADYAARGLDAEVARAFASGNCAFLLGADTGEVAGPTVRADGGWLATEEQRTAV